jgi:cell pole-organizing protein PopZ
MSGHSDPPSGAAAGAPPAGAAAGADPSMEDILASIRRILSEDEAAVPTPEPQAAPAVVAPSAAVGPLPRPPAVAEDVLTLDAAMIVPEDPHFPYPSPPAMNAPDAPLPHSEPDPMAAFDPPPQPAPEPVIYGGQSIVAPEVAAAASASVGGLVRALAERSTPVYRGGPSLEDIVRDELRPVLKQWLDTNLPPLVERLVRLEIERVVNRALL